MAARRTTPVTREDAIRAKLLRRAKECRTISYGELGRLVGMPAQGPWKSVLDKISREQSAKCLPDVTFLVINKRTGLPGQIGFKPAESPTADQRA